MQKHRDFLDAFNGTGGGPPARSEILQWGTGTPDGLTITDKKSVVDEAAYVNRPVALLDGALDIVSFGDAWATQNPCVKARFYMTGKAGAFRWIAERRTTSAASAAEWQLQVNDSNLLTFQVWLDGTTFNVASSATLSLSTLYETEAEYDRANNKLVLRYRVIGDASWITSETTGVTAGTISGATTANVGKALWNAGLSFQGYIWDVEVCDFLTGTSLGQYPAEETEGTTWFDVSGNSNDGAITTSDIATMRAGRLDMVSSWCALNGFRLSGSTQIPALADGTSAADGNALTNLGGYISNGADVDIVQTDADEAIFGGTTFFGDGLTWSDKTRAHYTSFINGTNNLWFKWVKINGVCYLVQWIQYPTAKAFTLAEYNKAVRWAGDPTCGAGVVPFP